MFKLFVLVACLVIVASTDDYDEYEHEDYYSHPKYKYGVKNPHTGDHKNQWEVRDEDVVKGAYTIQEADGTERVVEYKSSEEILPTDTPSSVTDLEPTTTMSTNTTQMSRTTNGTKKSSTKKPSRKRTSCC